MKLFIFIIKYNYNNRSSMRYTIVHRDIILVLCLYTRIAFDKSFTMHLFLWRITLYERMISVISSFAMVISGEIDRFTFSDESQIYSFGDHRFNTEDGSAYGKSCVHNNVLRRRWWLDRKIF